MHIKKYDFNYGRRQLMEKAVKGVAAGGVLTSLWPLLLKADTPDVTKAYPDELLSIEAHTKGKIKPGDVITKDNVEHVEHLLEPVQVWEVKNDGRQIKIREATTDVSELFDDPFLEATMRNRGKTIVDANGNLWNRESGKPGVGGLPFTEPKNGYEAQCNINMSWGRHNSAFYPVRDWDIGPDGNVQYQYEFAFVELQVTFRTDDKIWNGRDDLLRFNSIFFTHPNEQAGTSFLNTWPYDQTKFPGLQGYLPAFKRVREYPTSQRFEPLVPGISFYLSNAWAAGDPVATWGNHKIVDRRPMLGAPRDSTWHDRENWEPPVHGGPKGQTYWDDVRELVPEAIVVDMEPTQFPRSPVGKRRTWFDARNGMLISSVDYDRNGEVWSNWDAGFNRYQESPMMDSANKIDRPWSWSWVMSHDIQSGRMSRFYQAREIRGGYKDGHELNDQEVYDKFSTVSAMRRLGS